MVATLRSILLSHSVVFVAGFVAGKYVDNDELEMYRSAHESTFSRLRRQAKNVSLGIVVVGTIFMAARAGRSHSITE